ncbi:hypothetical protein SBRCBS47491_000501 [Sporothrix bragantina]|uniref:Glycosyltransferase family 28 N-terminal domain-containing protein n=1 Tax=Sporothrix bragantina TaxID=671064 RepID=A0ABP0AQY2_9PEZI
MSVQHLKLSSHSGFEADATVTDDGRVDIDVGETDAGKLAALLACKPEEKPATTTVPDVETSTPPKLNIVIQVVGSRGDVQPFVALGHVLRRKYGHRVRLVTHSVFKDFVEARESGGQDDGRLEFADIGGGDPAELMAFMVQNDKDGSGGLMPPAEAYTNGAIAQRRRFIEGVLGGCWNSMVDVETDFVADAIIANPPSFAHIHLAEAFGVPLHIMFTMPWTPTRSFPHPLANLKVPATSPMYALASQLSFMLVECLTWQGLGDLINRFRSSRLGLGSLSPLQVVAPFQPGGLMGRLRVPTTYCWAPALLAKPSDWADEVSVAGYFFGEEKSHDGYKPDSDLAAFLEGPPPVYVGFGSIVVDDPDGLTKNVLEAIRKADVRAIISKGWAGMGGATDKAKGDKIFFLEKDCPHEWLFPRMACVVHHGGAGTTAAGLRYGVPTVVVPFFGDQPFWGGLVAQSGAGPEPFHYSQLTADKLAESIKMALKPETKTKAKALGEKIREGQSKGGAGIGARSFHQHLDMPRCAFLSDRAAVWKYKKKDDDADKMTVQLSALAAAVLVHEKKLDYTDLTLFRPRDYRISSDEEPWDPFSGGGQALLGDLTSIAMAVTDFPRELVAKKKEASDKTETATTKTTETATSTVTVDNAMQAGQSVARIVSTGLQSPLHFCMGVARGFHNAPLLYNDEVRAAPTVSDFGGGVRAATKAFGHGLYDGVTGLVTQPLKGAEKDGGRGFVSGFAKGIGGIVLKPAAGAWAVPAYTMQGVQAEVDRLMKKNGSDSEKMEAQRVAARIRQAEAEWKDRAENNAEQRVLEGWSKAGKDHEKK